MVFKTSLLVSTMLAGVIAAGAAHAEDAGAAQPPPGARSAGQPGVSPPGVTPGVGAGASTNATGAAQQALQQGRTAQPDTNTVSEIVITAEKREQSLQQVPVAVTAFTTERRDLIGIQSIVDQTNYTPGLTYQANLDRVSLRGVGRLTNVHTADSGTALYTDGVFTTSTTDAGRDPLFIERTEILRGPQGTLYGRNAIGGAFNTITRKPTEDFSGEARVTVGNYDLQRYAATVSGPITDWLRFRIGYEKIYQGEGYNKNLVPGAASENGVRDRDYYQIQFDGTLGKFDFWVYYDQQHWNDRSTPGLVSNGGTLAPPEIKYFGTGGGLVPNASFGFGGGLNTVYQGPVFGNPALQGYSLRDFEHDSEYKDKLAHNDVFRTHLTYHAPGFDIKYIGGFLKYQYRYDTYDSDQTSVISYQVPLNPAAAPIATIPGVGSFNCAQLSALKACAPATVYPSSLYSYTEDEEFYSHEINIASTWDGPLQYIAGLYYYHEYSSNPSEVYDPLQLQIRTPSGPGALGIAGLPTTVPANPSQSYLHNNYFFHITSKAAFAQLDYKIIPQLKMTGGIRYTSDNKSGSEEERVIEYGLPSITDLTRYGNQAPAFDITLLQTGAVAAGTKQQGVQSLVYDPNTGYLHRFLKDGWNDVTGTAGLEWTPDRRTLGYLKYSRGYKAGGFATIQAATFSQQPYSLPEQIDAVEAGLKKDWTRHLQTNITGYYDMYYNAQIPLSIPAQGASSSIFYNIPRSIIQGVELETIWSPIDKLNLLFNYAYLDSHISKSVGAADPNDPTATQPGANPVVGGSTTGGVDPITGLPTRGQNLKGQALPFSPKNKLSLNVNYDYSLGKYGDVIPSFSYLWRDSQYSAIFNRSYNFAPARDQIDMRITYKPPNNKFEIIGYVQNLTNNTTFETRGGVRYSTGAVYSTYVLNDPRTYGIQLQARF